MKEFLNKHVILTTVRKAKYSGVICGFDIWKDKTCLNKVVILQKNGE